MGSQSVVVVKDWFVSGCQPIVLVGCLGCFAMLLTNKRQGILHVSKRPMGHAEPWWEAEPVLRSLFCAPDYKALVRFGMSVHSYSACKVLVSEHIGKLYIRGDWARCPRGKCHAAKQILAEPFCALGYKDLVRIVFVRSWFDYCVTCWFQNTSTHVTLGDWAHMPHLPCVSHEPTMSRP